jgi:peptidoglycan/xylan/chitin deacetylase (PgdA/CDA1 family)
MEALRTGILAVVLALLASLPARADVITRLPTDDKVIALTFDACQGHEPAYFDRPLLDYLLSRKLPFTLFVTGRFAQNNRADMEHLSRLGHVTFGNHSWDHPNTMNRFSAEATVSQAERADAAIEAITGRKPLFFRFPAGNFNDAGLAAVEAQGMPVIHWRWATGDPVRSETADRLVARVTRLAKPGDILIFHINGRGWHTAEALPRIVETLEAEGYRFVSLTDYVVPERTPPTALDRAAALARQAMERVTQGAAGASPFGAAR